MLIGSRATTAAAPSSRRGTRRRRDLGGTATNSPVTTRPASPPARTPATTSLAQWLPTTMSEPATVSTPAARTGTSPRPAGRGANVCRATSPTVTATAVATATLLAGKETPVASTAPRSAPGPGRPTTSLTTATTAAATARLASGANASERRPVRRSSQAPATTLMATRAGGPVTTPIPRAISARRRRWTWWVVTQSATDESAACAKPVPSGVASSTPATQRRTIPTASHPPAGGPARPGHRHRPWSGSAGGVGGSTTVGGGHAGAIWGAWTVSMRPTVRRPR